MYLDGERVEEELVSALRQCNLSDKGIESRKQLAKNFKSAESPTRRNEEWRWIDPKSVDLSSLIYNPFVLKYEERVLNDSEYAAKIEIHDKKLVCYVPEGFNRVFTIDIVSQNNCMIPETNGVLDKISLINEVFWVTGYKLNIKNNVKLDKPVLITEKCTETKILRCFIEIGRFSNVEIINVNESKAQSFSSLWITLNDSADLKYNGFQNRSSEVVDISSENVVLGRNSKCSWFSFLHGSKLVKLNQNCYFEGEGSSCELFESSILDNNENLHVIQNFIHKVPNTVSRIEINVVAKGETTSSFRGNITINKEAANSDAMLSNKCLLLSESAKVHSVPVLEILAKDVKCKHAASQGKVDTDQMFYMQSRGLNRTQAEHLITEGFVSEVFKNVHSQKAREMFDYIVKTKS